jgi:transcriptional regulator with XRE-family HTH domain
MNFLGKNLLHLRTNSSQRQADIALLVDKGQTTIGNWEKGVSEPCIRDLLILSNYFGIPVDILLRSDLAEAHRVFGAVGDEDGGAGAVGMTVKYKHDHNTIGQSLARENTGMENIEDMLAPIRREIESMREDMAQIKSYMKDP